MRKYLRLEYFYILMIIIWEPLQQFILKVDGAGYSILLLTVLLVTKLIKQKRLYNTVFEKPLIFYCIWVVYAFINTTIKGYGFDVPIISFFITIFVPFLLMVTISIEYYRNEANLLNILTSSLYLAIVIIILFIGETSQGRVGGEMNSNTIGTMATILSMLLYLKYYKKRISLLSFFILMIVPLYTVISTGSRTAFGGIILLFALHYIINRSKSILITLFQIIVAITVFILPVNYVLKETTLGDRLLNTTEQSQSMTYQTGNPILDKFGDRGIFYQQGWEVFKKFPLTGIGLGNFKHHNELELSQHSEYMIQLSELGIIGFCLFAAFYFTILKKLKNIKASLSVTNSSREVELYIYYIFIILAMITATRMYRVWFLFIITGFVIGYINEKKEKALLFKSKTYKI